VASADGTYQGYIKVFFNNLDVFQWDKERKKNILKVFWEAIVAGISEVFKNHVKDQLATKIPITGTYTNSSVGLWTATGTLLQNAFIRALVPKLDQSVTVDQVEQSAGK
jgi:hydrogenase maturation factor HypF (carbamoyltransferase family)